MNRAFVDLEIKSINEEERSLEGWASTIDEDRMGDIVMPRGAAYKLPMPFLLDHDHKQVVGEVNRVEVTDKGIKFWAQIKNIAEEGEAKALCDKAWSYIKNGLRRAVSIGFRPTEFEALPTGGLKFTKWDWYELSAVGIPAQVNATITGFKSYDMSEKFVAEVPAEFPDPEIPAAHEAAATGKKSHVVRLDDAARNRVLFVPRKIIRT